MEDHRQSYERRTSQLYEAVGPSNPVRTGVSDVDLEAETMRPQSSTTSPALSDGCSSSSSAESHDRVPTPPAPTDLHEKTPSALPPLRPETWGEGSERPFRHLGLDTRLSERNTGRHEVEQDEPEESEDRFGLGSSVSTSDKIKGRLTTLLGRVTNNSSKILEGQVRSNGAHLALRSEGRQMIE